MGYGQIVGGMKQSAAAKRRGSGSRVVSKYLAERDAITAKADTFEAVAHSAVSLHKGYKEGQTQWANLEAGAAELGLEEQIADKRAGAGRWEKWTGPSEKTLESMVQGDEVVDGKRLEITAGELKTMGKIKRTQGARYLKTMDPTTGKYKDIKDSGWGQMKDVPKGETVEPYSSTRKKDYSNFPVAESLMNKTGETLGSLTEWSTKKPDAMGLEGLTGTNKSVGGTPSGLEDVSQLSTGVPVGTEGLEGTNKSAGGVLSGVEGLTGTNIGAGGTSSGLENVSKLETGVPLGLEDVSQLATGVGVGTEGLGRTNIGAGGVLSGVEGLTGTNKSAGGVESGLEFLTSSGDASATGAGVGTEGLGRLPEDYFGAGYDVPIPPSKDNGVPLNRQDSYSPPPQGNDIPYDSYSSPPSQPSTPKITRGQAFQNARELGKKEFTYEGKKYHTRTKEEEDGLSAIPDENFNMMGYS